MSTENKSDLPQANLLEHIFTPANIGQLKRTMQAGWHPHRITIDLCSDSLSPKAYMHIYFDESSDDAT